MCLSGKMGAGSLFYKESENEGFARSSREVVMTLNRGRCFGQ
jgi:hypothetical protein